MAAGLFRLDGRGFVPDRQVEGSVSDVPFDYTGGFNRTLLALADALPVQAFLIRNQG